MYTCTHWLPRGKDTQNQEQGSCRACPTLSTSIHVLPPQKGRGRQLLGPLATPASPPSSVSSRCSRNRVEDDREVGPEPGEAQETSGGPWGAPCPSWKGWGGPGTHKT